MKKILVTGASGFIGQSLCETLSKSNRSVRGAVRYLNSFLSNNTDIEYVSVEDITLKTSWKDTLIGIDCIIHCAGRAHVMHEAKTDALKIYRAVNVDSTKKLAEQAAEAGVKRLIFLSSVKVNGEVTDNWHSDTVLNNQKKYIFTHTDIPNPQDPYAISKLEAEEVLWRISQKTDLEVTVVRLPLVYGNGAKGNLERLIKLLQSSIPLPLGAIQNQRSMIGIDNLINLLICCIDHPDAAGKIFLASDCEDLSTPDLINYIASSMGYKVRLFPFPVFLLKFLFSILGKKKEINRLVGSLKIDSSYTQEVLNWKPPISVAEGIKRMVQGK
jgi:nucleoside-diphosphate-sugar epimerase